MVYSHGMEISERIFDLLSNWINILKDEIHMHDDLSNWKFDKKLFYFLKQMAKSYTDYHLNTLIIRYNLSNHSIFEKYNLLVKFLIEQLDKNFEKENHFSQIGINLKVPNNIEDDILNDYIDKIYENLVGIRNYKFLIIRNPGEDLVELEKIYNIIFKNSLFLKDLKEKNTQILLQNPNKSLSYTQSFENLISLQKKYLTKIRTILDNDKWNNLAFSFDTGAYLLYQQRDGFENLDWDNFREYFLKNTKIVILNANDGTKNQRLLPYTKYVKFPQSKLPFYYKDYFENCHTLFNWLKELEKFENGRDKVIVFSIDPYFISSDLKEILKKTVTSYNNSHK